MARARSQVRSVAAYSMHARSSLGVVDYEHFLADIAALSERRGSRRVIQGQVVAITEVHMLQPEVMAVRFILGSEDEVPIFYNEATGAEESIVTPEGIFAVAAWTIFNTSTRLMALERKRPGISPAILERYIQTLGRDIGYGELRFDLNQVTSEEFDRSVKELDLVKRVTVVVNQPNLDWSDDQNEVHRYAEESQAASARLELVAPRGSSLSKREGVVNDVLGLARRAITSLKNVIVVGEVSGESGPKTINLNRFVRRVRVEIPRDLSALEELDHIAGPSLEMIADPTDLPEVQ